MGLIRILVFVMLALLAYSFFKRITGSGRPSVEAEEKDERLGRLVQDPNCLIYVDSREAVRRKVPDGELFFCSDACAKEYLDKAWPQGEKSHG